ncbi:hypothetical protein EVAR_22187_1 [Eumeta japonica]|uniref:Uncharacterized protein n=1 Tax=Eumeta variegata TaxID=151549 RepID=A0A4C1Y035_EUMVA|nr:hypothetical protein EVAR_22187_1 [Eumeta japonica]
MSFPPVASSALYIIGSYIFSIESFSYQPKSFNFYLGTVPDFDPSSTFDFNPSPIFGLHPGPNHNFNPGSGSRFCSASRLQLKYHYRSRLQFYAELGQILLSK